MATACDAELEVASLMTGKPASNRPVDICIRNEKKKPKSTVPKIGFSVCYVVTAVVFNEQGQLLMTREGFHPCYAKWYLPAGRVDPEETLAEAATREVREETGLEFEPTALLAVENPSSEWYRFTFTGNITGGKLRTQAEADGETLEAGWWDMKTVMEAARSQHSQQDPLKTFTLRGGDIIKLIKIGQEFFDHQDDKMEVLPSLVDLDKMLLRPVVVCLNPEGLSVLSFNQEGDRHVPVIDIGLGYNISSVILGLNKAVTIHGVLAVEHDGRKKMDGLCITVLASIVKEKDFPLAQKQGMSWNKITNPELKELFETKISTGGSIKLLH